MRLLFLLLAFANLAFYAYAQVARDRAGDARDIPALQISPEKIRLIGHRDSMPGARSTPSARASAAAACLEWGELAGGEAARADAALARLDLPQAQVRRTVTDADGYWVYIPPLNSKAEVDKRVAELKALKIPDIFVVQEAGQWRNAISLGIFKTEEGAQKFLDTLRGGGVKTAVAARREKFLRQISYLVREPGEAVVAQLADLQREFPASRIRAVACPAEPGKE